MIQDILSRKAQEGKNSRSQSLYNLKDAANMLSFLTRNKIMDMAGLDDCFGNMIGRQQSIRDKLKPIDRRLKTLDEHIKHSGNHKALRGKKAQYVSHPRNIRLCKNDRIRRGAQGAKSTFRR